MEEEMKKMEGGMKEGECCRTMTKEGEMMVSHGKESMKGMDKGD